MHNLKLLNSPIDAHFDLTTYLNIVVLRRKTFTNQNVNKNFRSTKLIGFCNQFVASLDGCKNDLYFRTILAELHIIHTCYYSVNIHLPSANKSIITPCYFRTYHFQNYISLGERRSWRYWQCIMGIIKYATFNMEHTCDVVVWSVEMKLLRNDEKYNILFDTPHQSFAALLKLVKD